MKILIRIFSVFVLFAFYLFLYKVLVHRISAFGCFDDCFNFGAGYFLLHGKALYTQIFFNHAPFMAVLSALVQLVTHPENLYQLVLRHRQFLLLFGFVSEMLLILRFGIGFLPFVMLYEVTKFYFFGDRFLAEGFVVYPLWYLLGLAYNQYIKRNIYKLDYIVCACAAWFVVFMREPSWFVVCFLYGTFLLFARNNLGRWVSLGLFTILTLVTLFSFNVYEFFYNVIYVNFRLALTENGSLLQAILYSIFYPFFILFQGQWNFVRYIEISLTLLFLFVSGFFLWKKNWKAVLLIWVTLSLANNRIVSPGQEYYASFHMVIWYALFIFSIGLLLQSSFAFGKKLFFGGIAIVCLLIVYTIFSKGSYVHDRIDEQTELITNYGNVLQVGNVVAALSRPTDTLFLDGSEDMIYVVAHRYSAYQYSWYTSRMPQYAKYTSARLSMFKKTPPDFYYGSCPGQKDPHFLLPPAIHNEYVRLYNLNSPSCLWVKKTTLASISEPQWQKAGENLYYLQPTTK